MARARRHGRPRGASGSSGSAAGHEAAVPGQVDVDLVTRDPRGGGRPERAASASTTSASPPVLANGSHSEVDHRDAHRGRAMVVAAAPGRASGPLRPAAACPASRWPRPASCSMRGLDAPDLDIPTLPTQDLRLPRKLEGLSGWPTTCTGRGTPRSARSSRASTARCGPASAAPSMCCVGRATGDAARRPRLHGQYPTVLEQFDRTWPTAASTGSPGATAGELDGPGGVLLRRVRPPRDAARSTRAAWACSPATTARRPRTWRCRSSRVGLFYRRGYFRQTIDADGHQEHDYVTLEPRDLPLRAGPGRGGRPAPRPGRGARAHRRARPSGSPRSAACRSSCSTRTCPRTPSTTGPSATSSTSAAARCASTRSSSSASAACARCARSASSPPPGTSTRATRRSCSSSRPASSWPSGVSFEDALARVRRARGVHDPHAGPGRQRALRGGHRAPLAAPVVDGSGLDLERIVEMGVGRGRGRRASST